jgi:hypothetical protein
MFITTRSIARFSVCALGGVIAIGPASIAIAAAPKKGAAYSGTLASPRTAILVTFKVSATAKKVSALKLTSIPLFCSGGGPAAPITFKAAAITSHGTFKSSANQIISTGPLKGRVGFRLKITGTFSAGRGEHGTLTVTNARAPSCGGVTTYTTRA